MRNLIFETIKHKNCVDVAFFVHKAVYIQKGRWQLRGVWVNISNPKKSHFIVPDKIVITPEQRPNWKLYDQTQPFSH